MSNAQPKVAAAVSEKLIRDVEDYLLRYVVFPGPEYSLPAALWVAATFMWPHFDAFPYMVITSDTKRSGKTRLSELLSFVCSNPRNFAAATPAALFRMIRDEQPTIFMDEAEELSSEAATTMRTVLNVGYRKGQMIPRLGKNGVEEWPAYCPKVFVLIGDVFDTLRDRSIIVRLKRGEPRERFLYEVAKADGADLRDRLADFVADRKDAVLDRYMRHDGLDYLGDRDEEIWLPLFAIAAILAPSRLGELQRSAVDLATEKTMAARNHSELEMKAAEREATTAEYAERLVRDLLTVIGTRRHIFTADALKALHDLPTGPWRKFRGEGLTPMEMSSLLSRFGVAPRHIREGGSNGKGGKVARGYRRDEVVRAVKGL